jgi:hypothetical protein
MVHRLSYSQAQAAADCPKRGLALRRRQLPMASGPNALRILAGHALDRIVALAYEERWWRYGQPLHAELDRIIRDAVDHVHLHELPCALTDKERADIITRLQPVSTLVAQMDEYGLIPEADVRVQAVVERPYEFNGRTVKLTGIIDLMVANPAISVVDVKSGSYHKAAQLSWYLRLLEAYAIVPHRVGFWMPLQRKIEWRVQTRLPKIDEMITTALTRLDAQDDQPTPGSQCGLCPLFQTCEPGIQYLHRMECASASLHVAAPGVHNVGFGA